MEQLPLQPARLFFKIMYNIFLLSSKNIPFEQYYRLHVSGPTIAICETKSNNVFVLTHTSFDQNNFFFLHAVQDVVEAFNAVLRDFVFFQKLAPYDPIKHPTQPNPSKLPTWLLVDVLSLSSQSSPIFNFSL